MGNHMTGFIESRAFVIVGALASIVLVGVFAWSAVVSDSGARWSYLIGPAFYATSLLAPRAQKIGPLEPLVIGLAGAAGVGLALFALLSVFAKGDMDGVTALIFLLAFAFVICLAWFGFATWWTVRNDHRKGIQGIKYD